MEKENNNSNISLVQKIDKSILVGMTGKVDSVVTAYLLKKQGYRVMALAILFHPYQKNDSQNKPKEKNRPKNQGKSQNSDDDDEAKVELIWPELNYDIYELGQIKEICTVLDIPLYVTDASARFENEILSLAVSCRLAGKLYSSCLYAHTMIFDILLEKANRLKIDRIATGHYVRIHKDPKHHEFSLSVARDHENDQSYLLGHLELEHLERLELPLAELTQREIHKLEDLLVMSFRGKIQFKKSEGTYLLQNSSDARTAQNSQRTVCLSAIPELDKIVAQRAPASLIKSGSFIHLTEETYLGDHNGHHEVYLGQKSLKSVTGGNLDQNFHVLDINTFKGSVFIGPLSLNIHPHMMVGDFKSSFAFDRSIPLAVFIGNDMKSERYEAHLFFKNNNIVIVEWGKPEDSAQYFKGQTLAFYFRSGQHLRLIATGVALNKGDYTPDLVSVVDNAHKTEGFQVYKSHQGYFF